MTSKTETNPMTAHEIRSILTAAGVTGATVEVVLHLTALARHEARVRDVMHAALEYAEPDAGPGVVDEMVKAVYAGKRGPELPRPNCVSFGDCWALAAAAHCGIEAWIGRGGHAGAGGPGRGTDRAPWARGLGKGRYWADDDAAWDAALADASVCLAFAAGAASGFVALEPTGEGLRACAPGASVRLSFDSPAQAYAVCVRGLCNALPDAAPHRLPPLDPKCNLQFWGSLDEWARTLDRVGLAGADAAIPEGIDEDGLRRLVSIGEPFNPWLNQAVAVRLEALRRDASGATSA